MTSEDEKLKKWITANLSCDESRRIHDLCTRAYLAGFQDGKDYEFDLIDQLDDLSYNAAKKNGW